MNTREQNKREVIIITGSSGLIGRSIAQRLTQKYQVIGLDTKRPQFTLNHFEHIQVDLTSDESVQKAFLDVAQRFGNHLASVIHLAAFYDFSGRPNPLYDEITVYGTERLLNVLKGFQVEQFIFSSTMLVHTDCAPEEKINEDWPMEAKWPYPESKIKTEQLLLDKHGHIPLVIMRIAGVYDNMGHSIPVAHQIHHIYEKMLIARFFPGDKQHGQAFVHLEDLTQAFELAVSKRKSLPSEFTVLIGEPQTFSFERLQQEISGLIHKKPWSTFWVPKPVAQLGAWARKFLPLRDEPLIQPKVIPFADDHYALDISRAQEVLGWTPRHSLLRTLPSIIIHLKRDPLKWYKENKIAPPSWLEQKKVA